LAQHDGSFVGKRALLHIGVITPAWNAAAFVGAAVRSVLAQTHDDWSMVVVDDGSADDTAQAASAFRDPRLRVIRQANAGVSAARNRGMALLDADAYLFLDADDRLSPFAIAALAATLKPCPAAVASFGGWCFDSGDAHADGFIFICFCWFGGPMRPTPIDMLGRLLTCNRFVNGGHLLIAKSAIRSVGGFRTDLRFGEDWEYWIRLALLGRFVPVREHRPLLLVRSRPEGAYRRMAADPRSFDACMGAIFTGKALGARVGPAALRHARQRAEAENAWIVGREMIRQGRVADGRRWLAASVRAAPSAKRLTLVGASWVAPRLPTAWRGPFRPYAAGTESEGSDPIRAASPAS